VARGTLLSDIFWDARCFVLFKTFFYIFFFRSQTFLLSTMRIVTCLLVAMLTLIPCVRSETSTTSDQTTEPTTSQLSTTTATVPDTTSTSSLTTTVPETTTRTTTGAPTLQTSTTSITVGTTSITQTTSTTASVTPLTTTAATTTHLATEPTTVAQTSTTASFSSSTTNLATTELTTTAPTSTAADLTTRTTAAETSTTVPITTATTPTPTTVTTTFTSTTTPTPNSNLNITIEGLDSLFAGQTGVISYIVKTCNTGLGRARDVVIGLQLPLGMYQSGLVNGLRLICQGEQNVRTIFFFFFWHQTQIHTFQKATCNVTGQLLPNSCVEARVVVYVFTVETSPSLTIRAWASTSSQPAETFPSASKTVTINIKSDIQLERFTAAVAVAGSTQFYEIVATNSGPSQAYGVVLTTVSPFPIQSWTAQAGAICGVASDQVTLVCNIGNLPVDTTSPNRGVAVDVLYTVPRNQTPTISAESEAPSPQALPVQHTLTATSITLVVQPITMLDSVDILQRSSLVVTANCSLTSSIFHLSNEGPSDCSSFDFHVTTIDSNQT
jgi:hypothetical protein